MHYFYVYLIKPEKRLIITQQKISEGTHELLLDCNGGDKQTLLACCKTFCSGYIQGNRFPIKIVNDPQEFSN